MLVELLAYVHSDFITNIIQITYFYRVDMYSISKPTRIVQSVITGCWGIVFVLLDHGTISS